MDFLNLAMNFGVAVACLVSLSLAVWRALVFIGSNVFRPLVERHVAFLDKLQVALEKQTQVVDRLVGDHEAIIGHMGSVTSKLDRITHDVGEVKELILTAEKSRGRQTRGGAHE